jgi:hypothetical protein
MRTTRFGEDQKIQDLYFDHDHSIMPGWFKGMEVIIWECGLWPEKGLNTQCDGFKRVAGKTDCCCHRLLFTQPNFMAQKSHLEELITSHRHICNFYPKYHCKLNFIGQYWGAAKLCYRNSPKPTDINEMEANMKACLDNVPLVQIKRCVTLSFYFNCTNFSPISRYANQSACFINAYAQGATRPIAIWANQKYHRHCTLLPKILSNLKNKFHKKYRQD